MDIQKDQSNHSIAPTNIYSHLASTEKVLSVFGPFYATSLEYCDLTLPTGLAEGICWKSPTVSWSQ